MKSPCLESIALNWRSPPLFAPILRELGYFIWLDSTVHPTHITGDQRYDILMAAPEWFCYMENKKLYKKQISSNITLPVTTDPFLFLEALSSQYAPVSSSEVPFCGGLAGYFGYELNHWVEPNKIPFREHDLPNLAVGLYLWNIVIDHQLKQVTLYCHPELSPDKKQLILKALSKKTSVFDQKFQITTPFKSKVSSSEYQDQFNRIQRYIQAGDCYQVNLTQQFSATYSGDLLSAYLQLRETSPNNFSAYMEFEDLTILSHSPERLIQLKNRDIQVKPIKGTRPRGKTLESDQELSRSLLASTKDRAENLMIVDLLRNDLNRYCEINSVRVTHLFELISTANVHHLVSTIEGKLKEKITPFQLLKSIFPGGSVSGAPKIRAMQIINELELTARSVYCGALGYISFSGDMDFNIPIRTLIAQSNELRCWGGGAIVSDSQCDLEYEESWIKINNLIRILEKNHELS